MEILSNLINIAAVLCLIFGLYVVKLDTKNRLYRIFFILCIIISVSGFSSGRVFTADNMPSYALWDGIGIILVALCWAVNLHFCILLTEKNLKKWQTFLIYLPAVIMIGMEFTPYRIVEDYINYGEQWKAVYADSYYLYMFYSVFYTIIDVVLVYRWGIKSSYKKQKLQVRVILSATILLFLVCAVMDYVFPYFDFYKLPAIGCIGLLIYAIILWYSFVKYRFLMPKASLLLHEIVFNIHETVVLLNADLKIQMFNNKLNELFNSDYKDYSGICFFDLLEENDEIKQNLNRIRNGDIKYCYCRLNYKTSLQVIVTDSYITGVVDKFKDLTGILIVSVENKGIKQFRKIYGITDRQMAIIDLCLMGYSNAEISDKLGISKRTADSHIFHIYNRLGINNKIELFNIAKEFNILLKRGNYSAVISIFKQIANISGSR